MNSLPVEVLNHILLHLNSTPAALSTINKRFYSICEDPFLTAQSFKLRYGPFALCHAMESGMKGVLFRGVFEGFLKLNVVIPYELLWKENDWMKHRINIQTFNSVVDPSIWAILQEYRVGKIDLPSWRSRELLTVWTKFYESLTELHGLCINVQVPDELIGVISATLEAETEVLLQRFLEMESTTGSVQPRGLPVLEC